MSTIIKFNADISPAQITINEFFERLNIPMFEGPQSNSGYNTYEDTLYRTKQGNREKTQHLVGCWVVQQAGMYGWDWRIVVETKGQPDNPSIVLRRLDCLGNATDMLVVNNETSATLDTLDEAMVVLLKQGGYLDELRELHERGLMLHTPPTTQNNPSVWQAFDKVSDYQLAKNAVTRPEVFADNQVEEITKTFSTDDGDVNTFWLSTFGDQTYLTICGMGLTFTAAHMQAIELPVVDHLFMYFFSAIQEDTLSATSQGRAMASIYQNKLLVLGGLRGDAKYLKLEAEVDAVFDDLVAYMEAAAEVEPDRIRYNRDRVGRVRGISYYTDGVDTSVTPLRFWLSSCKVKNVEYETACMGTACIVAESRVLKAGKALWFPGHDPSVNDVHTLLDFLKNDFEVNQNAADAALIEELRTILPTE